ncbi:MAG: CerR family C-terminal domain-containing protein [Desulfuromonadales bacterium]|nr:CerR family C-terminal domain-containing protein [Desulfuromonadales bacterium]
METQTNDTRLRLLEAAALVFARHGYAASTVRMICAQAKVNGAAINYHFGSKDELYHEVLRHVRRRAYDTYPTTHGLTAVAPPHEKLRAFINSFLLRIFDEERNPGFGTLMIREMVEPTSALDMLVEEGICSLFSELVGIVRSIMGNNVEQELVYAASRSAISQCVFFLCSRSVISRLSPQQTFGPGDIELLTEQITAFTLCALNGLAKVNRVRP